MFVEQAEHAADCSTLPHRIPVSHESGTIQVERVVVAGVSDHWVIDKRSALEM
jgi:hypothetical protein